MDFSIFANYTFLVVLSGTMLLGIASGMVGSISVLKEQSLIGDSIGHASFPGIVLFFMLFLSRNPTVLMTGAVLAGLVAYFSIQLLKQHSSTKTDTILAVVLSSFFGLGMVLKSYIQGNMKFSGASQSGLQNYIFGQAAYMTAADRQMIFIVSLVVLFLMFLFYKEIQLYIFDENYGTTIGFSKKWMSALVVLLTIALIAVGLRIVGAILISAMLITPAVAALQWSHRYPRVLALSGAFGGISAIVGTAFSSAIKGMSTGPSIVLVMSFIALFSILFNYVRKLRNNRKQRRERV